MTQTEAISLIERANLSSNSPKKWTDLGCGNGLFTYALAALLPKKSHILAVDKVNQVPVKSLHQGVSIEFLQADFIADELPINGFDGILMANALHYVKNQRGFIQSLGSQIAENGRFIIVEYDTERANPWVPYPVSFIKLKKLFESEGYSSVRKIGEQPSMYGDKNMYACEVE